MIGLRAHILGLLCTAALAGGGGEASPALDLNFLTATIDSSGAPDADSGTTQLTYTNRTSHAMQYNSDGVLEYAPHNTCTYSEDMSNAAWTKQANVVVTPNQALDPDGNMTADLVVGTGPSLGIFNTYDNNDVTNLTTMGIWLRGVNGGETVRIQNASQAVGTTTCNLTTAWQYFTLTEVSGHASQGCKIYIRDIPAGCIYMAKSHTHLANADDTYIATTSAPVYGARISHKPVTNLLSYPEQFDNAYWASYRSSLTSSITDPFGGTNAFKLVETLRTANSHYIYASDKITNVSGKTYTFSAYVEPDERNWAYLSISGGSFPAATTAYFDTTNGVVGTIGAGVDSHGIVQVEGTNYYRIWITSTATSTTSTTDFYLWMADSDGGIVYDSDGSSGLNIFGAQVNEGGIEDYIGCTNLLDDDKAFNLWLVDATLVTADDAVAPDGTTTADLMYEANSNLDTFGRYQDYSADAGTYQFKFFAKQSTRQYASVYFCGEGLSYRLGVYVDLADGTVVETSETGVVPTHTYSVTLNANGYYEIEATMTVGAGTIRAGAMIGKDASPSWSSSRPRYTGDSASGIHIWGGQLTKLSGASGSGFPYVGQPQTGYVQGGYLAEPAATNLLPESNIPDANYIKVGSCTLTDNAVVGLNGELSATLMTTANATSVQGIYDSFTVSGTSDNTIWYVVKSDGLRFLQLLGGSNPFSLNTWANFDIITGEVGTIAADVTDTHSWALGNGWRLIGITAPGGNDTGNGGLYMVDSLTATRVSSVTGDGVIGVAIDHGQCELGTYPSSHFPTTGGSATRSADLLEETGFSYYNATEGTLVYEGSPVQPVTAATDRVTFNNDTANEVLKITDDASANTDFDVTDGGVSQASIDSGENAVNGVRRIVAAGYKANDFGASIDGATAVTDVSGTVPTPTQLVFGDGYHRSFKYWGDNSALATRSLSTDDGTTWRDDQ